MLEVNIIIFILIIESNSLKSYSQSRLFYFIIQSVGSFIILSSCCRETVVRINLEKESFLLAILIKIGLFPFHTWIFKIRENIKELDFVLLLTLQKIPILILLRNLKRMTSFVIILTRIAIGSCIIWKRKSIKEILVSSSIYSTIWIILAINLEAKIFTEIFIFYSATILALIELRKKARRMRNTQEKWVFTRRMIFLVALPPTRFMLYKTFIFNFRMRTNSIMTNITLWMFTFIATMSYLKITFSKSWITKEKLYKNFDVNLKIKVLGSIITLGAVVIIF